MRPPTRWVNSPRPVSRRPPTRLVSWSLRASEAPRHCLAVDAPGRVRRHSRFARAPLLRLASNAPHSNRLARILMIPAQMMPALRHVNSDTSRTHLTSVVNRQEGPSRPASWPRARPGMACLSPQSLRSRAMPRDLSHQPLHLLTALRHAPLFKLPSLISYMSGDLPS